MDVLSFDVGADDIFAIDASWSTREFPDVVLRFCCPNRAVLALRAARLPPSPDVVLGFACARHGEGHRGAKCERTRLRQTRAVG